MKISVCYIQYNRIFYLLESLKILEKQNYQNIEVVICDDASTDETEALITKLKQDYKFPIIYARNTVNMGYDRNYRRCMELATGKYCIVLGNDDAIIGEHSLANLVAFLEKEQYPDVGFVNYFEFATPNIIVERASQTKVIGSGKDVAIKFYNCFSFVGGLIYRKSIFEKYNTNRYDGSIYSQMYIGTTIVLNGGRLFSIAEPLVGKDIQLDRKIAFSYRDKIEKKWTKIKKVDGGLPSVMNVMINALIDAKQGEKDDYYQIFKKIYVKTYPYWILDYKYNNATPEAIGLIWGLCPVYNKNIIKLHSSDRMLIYFYYAILGFGALIFPSSVFFKYKHQLYAYLKK